MRRDKGINLLDEACKLHDIAYLLTENITDYHKADKVLRKAASNCFRSSNSNIGESTAAFEAKVLSN